MVNNQKRSHVPRGQESFCCQIMAAVSFLHFNLLLWNHWAKFNLKLTGVEVSIEIEITTLCCLFLSKFIQWLIKDFFFFSDLFTNILDMLCVLIHGTLVNDGMEKGEENTKSYTTLIKKLRVRPFLYHASGLVFF